MDGTLVGFAEGWVEAASHVETSLMQCVQHTLVQAQARAVHRRTGGFLFSNSSCGGGYDAYPCRHFRWICFEIVQRFEVVGI